MRISFTKMQGLGNDFILVDDLNSKKRSPITPKTAQKICDRRLGIGADQVLWLKRARDKSADARMEILNADGSMAEMCGNGIRAVAIYLNRYGRKRKKKYLIETRAGILPVELKGSQVKVGMGVPRIAGDETLDLAGRTFSISNVDSGVPHAIIHVDDVARVPLEDWGPKIENHPCFPHKTNVDFYQMLSERKIRLRVWERGAGVTLACGTGACATAVAAILSGRAKSPVEVELPGGCLRIEWDGNGKPVVMTGPAALVFRGEWLG